MLITIAAVRRGSSAREPSLNSLVVPDTFQTGLTLCHSGKLGLSLISSLLFFCSGYSGGIEGRSGPDASRFGHSSRYADQNIHYNRLKQTDQSSIPSSNNE